ncbi:hypothetical protein F9C07_2231036 [Aspergillus flavus]|uniref:Uncharacterized protein n=5 Tax=Aspergillus subgen. Circumdati TaxID=2720871 RepID=A0A7U2QX73_ASPFN|nr:unnamed protein product [Aspergillus oryzae RIB40]EIT83115.1 hypothetical protein Ao3042_11641 [Aspergillus oryzae 3.042]KAF7620140.1 hypothetical protein AFLA_005454 [Aspergillus flavus NRRL3357]KAJ1713655.1 hypothetical protein NYO67_4225 [Aspergillus flavus]KDE79758.1 hypothetical protein AO1008_05728 [Aspergillus oryzae 100-8]OOO14537.1 hypothetical protein OAory_01031320 [Aspergillus oryzae]|eukprot:EIT83115.1 hypothetical protein Ao3042_11641 [Aspergillus oryzae 3.042]
MPIKLPKGFARRKSSGNALEEGENPPAQSFRVFERPSVDKKSYSEGNLLAKRLSDGQRFYPTAEDSDNIFAEVDSPGQRSPGGMHERPKSARFHSATDRSTDGLTSNTPTSHSRNLYDIPIPPLSGALRAAGRTFSFGGRFSKASAPTPPPQPSTPGPSRSRAMTASTTSTATPPKLLDTDLQLGQGEDEFHNMFDEVGKMGASRERSGELFPSSPELVARKQEKSPRPTPINTDRSKEIEPSPYSWDSRHSGEGLLMASDSPQDHTPALQQTLNSQPVSPEGRRKSLPLSGAVPRTTTHRSLEQPQAMSDKSLRRSVLYPSKRASTPVEDEDAKLIMESLYTNKRSSQILLTSEHENSDAEHDTPLFSNSHAITVEGSGRSDAKPMLTHKSLGVAEDHPDPSIAAHARLAAQYEERQPVPTASSNKVMTPSQFEHYRQQQELRRSNSDASKSEDSAESEFDEEDEAEKNREVERQRRKQEAHLSVYRQQMMKVTGQESPAPALRSEFDRANNSTPNLTVTPLNSGHRSGSGKSSEGDEDEEIPLGILAAHGFPNRNRPPSRLVPSNSIPNLRASFHQPYISSSSSVADHEPGNRSSLPVFARNLPRDPYFGASLVNPSNRESLAFGGGSSVYGGPAAAAGPSPALPPGGLVGVIATEERARAMRRGSPNTQAMYEYQGGPSTVPTPPSVIPRPYTMMSMNPPGPSGPQSGISATEQAQIQLSQQMSSMMQMQMQWMQQMIQMQSGQVPPQQLAPPGGFPPTASANANMRPSSMPSAGGVTNSPVAYRNDQRTLSMLDPNVSSRLNSPATPYNVAGNRPSTPAGQGYAPSIAPSERSNVGLAPRYRPVSMLQPESGPAAFPFMSKSWNDENQKSTLSVPPDRSLQTKPTIDQISSGDKSAIISTTVHGADPDDDDDEGWAEMMKKREKKRNNWKMKKETSSFGDLLNAVH